MRKWKVTLKGGAVIYVESECWGYLDDNVVFGNYFDKERHISNEYLFTDVSRVEPVKEEA